MKLGQNAYDIVSVTTTHYLNNTKQPHVFTYSLLILANGSTHGDETWYACVLHHFHDDNMHFSLLIFYRGLAPFHRDMRSNNNYMKMRGDKVN